MATNLRLYSREFGRPRDEWRQRVDNRAISIDYKNGKPEFNPKGPYEELTGNSITLSITTSGSGNDVDFPEGSHISMVGFFTYPEKQTVGVWRPAKIIDHNSHDIYQVLCKTQHVIISDIESNTKDDDRYYFAVNVDNDHSQSGGWHVDPEIINKGSG